MFKKALKGFLILALSIIFNCSEAFAKNEIQTSSSDMIGNTVNVFGSLIALIALMYILALSYKKLSKSRFAKALSGNKYSRKDIINILSTTALGQGKYLHIIEVGSEKILIGSTSSNITMLKDIKEDIVYKKVDFDE